VLLRVLALGESPPDGAVVSFDHMGPVVLRSTAGAGWAPRVTAQVRGYYPRRRRIYWIQDASRPTGPATRHYQSKLMNWAWHCRVGEGMGAV
jgi:hypothetical protein